MRKVDAILQKDRLNEVSADRWATAVAAIFMGFPLETLKLMAAGGFSRFYAVSEPILRGHSFRRPQYRAIFDAIQLCVKHNQRISPEAILKASKSVH